METRSIILCSGGQKGGAGKSFLTTLLASYIHEKTDHSVVVIDADDKQLSIQTRRDSEEDSGTIPEGTDPFPVHVYSSAEAGEKILKNEMGIYDFILVDFPGTLSQAGVVGAYALIDMILIPVNILSPSEIDSTVKFCKLLVNKIDPFRKERDFPESEKFFVFNKVKLANKEFKNSELTNKLKEGTPFPTLDNMIPLWTVFERNWQTYVYPDMGDDTKKQKIIDAVSEEMFSKALALFKKHNK